jgi:phosphatidylserine decarboxylase
MKLALWRDRLLQQEDLNFLLTNRIPRLTLTRLVGWYSRIESPLLTRFSIAVWRLFTDLDLSEARQQRFRSLQDCFIRELKPGARPLAAEADAILSPCDAIVGACGAVEHQGQVFQAKGFPYTVGELFGDVARAAPYRGGQFVTLRLTSSMYHRFHAPADLSLEHVTHIAGDTWNVNPIALKRVERLFCRNERAAIHARLPDGRPMALVAVAAILVASLRLHCLNLLLHVDYPGPHELPAQGEVKRGEELGWFQQGSTIIVFLPPGFELAVQTGQRLRMGEVLARP